MNIETNNVTVSLEPLDISKIKIDTRPPISKQRSIKGRAIENSENQPQSKMASQNDEDAGKTCDPVTCKPLDSVENISNGRTSLDKLIEEPKLFKEEPSETRHLKDLLLLHLDLIQQQQDLLVMKERQISHLKQDNNTLRCRLERMERRVSMVKGVTPVKSESLSPMTVDREPAHKTLKRKNSLEPQSLAKRFAKIARNDYENEKIHRKVRGRHSAPGGRFEKHKIGHRKGFSRLSFSQRRSLDKLKRKKKAEPSRGNTGVTCEASSSHVDSDPESHWISRTLRNRHLTSTGLTVPTPQKSQLIVRDETADKLTESKNTPSKRTDSKHQGGGVQTTPSQTRKRRVYSLPKDSQIMKTGLMYYVPDLDVDQCDSISPRKHAEDQVDVPSFRVKKFTPYYVIEGTENYDDEVFGKRHQKHELEEKKRKRWDLQRQREQEQLQKLQQKHNTKIEENEEEEREAEKLRPDTNRIEFIEVSDEVPVSVFGVPIPKLHHRDFEVPWFDRERRDRQEARKCKSRRR